MIWWITNLPRFKSEMVGLEALRDSEPWLLSIKTSLQEDLHLIVECVIDLNGEMLPLVLDYPAFFPEVPPTIRPRKKKRLSAHQYADGGELCLEFRSDNWDPSITGVMMLESAHRLLTGEQPTSEVRASMPDAHQTTVGQSLRGASLRFLLTRPFQDYVARLAVGDFRSCRIEEIFAVSKGWTAFVATVGVNDDPEWRETTIPIQSKGKDPAFLIRVELFDPSAIDQAAFDALTKAAEASNQGALYRNSTSRYIVVADQESAGLFYSLKKNGVWHLSPFQTIDVTTDTGGRLAVEYANLREKKIGLIGCGSLGSKVAVSLARNGIGKFVLVDDDILKPGNLIRHDLDVTSLGQHKANALKTRLCAVTAFVDVSVRRVVLGGQEASGTTASVLEELATCDILIDATANPQAFNLVASVARTEGKAMMWAEVLAGGIGGFVARLRPDMEPTPHRARQQYLGWCEEQGVPWQDGGSGYETNGVSGPIIADDADVSAIAAHATRMATDYLIQPDNSIFPYPAYLIGLKRAWLFTEPFDVHPISFVRDGPWQAAIANNQTAEAIDYLTSIITPSEENEAATGT